MFWKRATPQPARNGRVTDPYLFSDGGLRETELTEDYHLLVLSQTFLSFCLTERNVLWKHIRRLGNLRSLDGRGFCCFYLLFPLSRKMTCQHTRQSLTKVFEQMEPICRLRGSWNCFPGGGCKWKM